MASTASMMITEVGVSVTTAMNPSTIRIASGSIASSAMNTKGVTKADISKMKLSHWAVKSLLKSA